LSTITIPISTKSPVAIRNVIVYVDDYPENQTKLNLKINPISK